MARGYLSDAEMRQFYRKKAREFEAGHKWKDAEKAYLQVGGCDDSQSYGAAVPCPWCAAVLVVRLAASRYVPGLPIITPAVGEDC